MDRRYPRTTHPDCRRGLKAPRTTTSNQDCGKTIAASSLDERHALPPPQSYARRDRTVDHRHRDSLREIARAEVSTGIPVQIPELILPGAEFVVVIPFVSREEIISRVRGKKEIPPEPVDCKHGRHKRNANRNRPYPVMVTSDPLKDEIDKDSRKHAQHWK